MNIRELAKLAGVSVSTVSKIMNHKDESISQTTRDRVLKIAKEYNYQSYSSMLDKDIKTLTLGVIFRTPANISTILTGILEKAQTLGYSIMLRESGNDPEKEFRNISVLVSHHVDGIIWEPVNEDSLKHCEYLASHNTSYVLFNSPNAASYNIDYEALGRKSTQTLIDMGHTSIACVLTPGTRTEAFSNGYKQCLFFNHIPLDEELIFHNVDRTLIQKISSHMVSGIVNSHYSAAVSLYDAISVLHYELPYDISLISLKHDSPEKSDYPRISTFTIPYYKYGKYLCGKLIHDIEKKKDSYPDFNIDISLDNEYSIGIPYHSRSGKIAVIGSINIDNYLKVDKLPHTGKTVSSSTSAMYVGGKAVNEAIGISKLGHHVALIGRVGNDTDSDRIYTELKNYGIDPVGVSRCSGYRTGQAYIFVQGDGNSMISIMSGANEALTESSLSENERLFENTAYCLIQTEIPIDTVLEACKIAKKHGICTILKPAACGILPPELLKNIDIIVPNHEEIDEICPIKNNLEKQAQYLLDSGVGTVIITMGAEGCYLKNSELSEYFSALPFDSVDASGACDAFISALASYLLYGYPLLNAVKIASYAAGFSVTREGVVPSLVDKNTLESYILQREPDLLKHS